MEVFVWIGAIIAVIGTGYWFYRRKKAQALHLSPQDVAQINRVYLIATREPLLALEMAQRLEGHARQLALQYVAPPLVKNGHRAAGFQALAELVKPNHVAPLQAIIETLLEQGDPQAARELMDIKGSQLPDNALLTSINLDLATGRQDSALKHLKLITEMQEVAGTFLLSRADSLKVAALQRTFDLNKAAAVSIAWAWSTLGADGQLDRQELRAILQEFFTQDGAARVIELAEQLPEACKDCAASVLFDNGELEPALILLGQAGTELPYETYPQLLALALAAERLEDALRLIDSTSGHVTDELLLQLLQWHVQRGETAAADALIQARLNSPVQRLTLGLELATFSHAYQPQWSLALRQQSAQQLEQLRGEEDSERYQLLVLEGQLQAQAHLPEARRDPSLIRSVLEQIAPLNASLEMPDIQFRLEAQALLLHALGQDDAAGQRLQVLAQHIKDHPDEDDEDEGPGRYGFSQKLDLEQVAETYLRIDQPQPAMALRDELERQDFQCREVSLQIALNHIRHQRLAQAIEALDVSTLMGGENLLTRLFQAIEQLQAQAPTRYRELREKLLDTLINGDLSAQPVP